MSIIQRFATENYVNEKVTEIEVPIKSVNGKTGEITINEVPSCTTSNNGQFLIVVDGIATWTTINNAEGMSF